MADLNAVLELVNKTRKIQGKEPLPTLLKGKVADGKQCPLARSLEITKINCSSALFEIDEWNNWQLHDIEELWNASDSCGCQACIANMGNEIPIPLIFEEFIEDFDDGEYPELIETVYPELVIPDFIRRPSNDI